LGSQATAEALLLVLTVLGRATSLEYLPSAPRCTTPLAVATPLRKAWERSQELTAPVAPCGGNSCEPTTVFQFFSKKKIKKPCGGSQAKQFLFNELVFLGSRQNPPRADAQGNSLSTKLFPSLNFAGLRTGRPDGARNFVLHYTRVSTQLKACLPRPVL
jgi:hypothetical protein